MSAAAQPANLQHIMEQAKQDIADVVLTVLPGAFPEVAADSVAELRGDVLARTVRTTVKGQGELSLPCFVFGKKIKGPPAKTSEALAAALSAHLAANPHATITFVKAAGPYLNFGLSTTFLATVLQHILQGDYLKPLPQEGKLKVMIEYSQPNTHKAFHVGHMRNVALGDALVRLNEQLGHPVVAVNYFGDEGAHVAKCLWFLTRYLQQHPSFDMDKDVAPSARGEWLGQMYSAAVEALDLGVLTKYPFPHVVPAKVLSIDNHPAADAPPNWHVVKLAIDAKGGEATVVCGGKGYNVGDLVAYMPVGAPMKGKLTVQPKDMKGVESAGIMMAARELGIEDEEPAPAAAQGAKKGEPKAKAEPKPKAEKAPKAEKPKADAAAAAAGGDAAAAAAPAKKENKGKGAKEDRESPNNRIYTFPADLVLGVPVTDQGRLPNLAHVPADKSILVEHEERKEAVREMLRKMEHGEPEIMALWDKTKEWSLTEFRNIYKWLGARFDHDFFESECSEPSRKLVDQYRGSVFKDSNGALGADLASFGLGFCMVLKSDGAGLYATKDLALAKRKFDDFGIDQSIYVVDAAQTLHFKQVFKTLELMGYERAKHCVHIPYGQVVLPSGKMSSRTGTVIMFSQLKELLAKDIYTNFLAKYDEQAVAAVVANAAAEAAQHEATTPAAAAANAASHVKVQKNQVAWSADELARAQQAISVATIRYGMLNHDVAKDIVFVLEEWTARSGNTGVYMLYAYSRIQSIVREVKLAQGEQAGKVDFSLLTHESERTLLLQMHDLWDVLEKTVELRNPSTLCNYLFDLSKSFSSWYEVPSCSVNNAASEDLKVTRVEFIKAIAAVIKLGLNLLGIQTLERM